MTHSTAKRDGESVGEKVCVFCLPVREQQCLTNGIYSSQEEVKISIKSDNQAAKQFASEISCEGPQRPGGEQPGC